MEAQKRIWLPKDETLYLRSREEADDVEYIRADLVPAWRPIETAPKNEYVLLWGGGSVLFGIYGWEEDDGPVFYHDGPGYRGCTHWMPLPEPPASKTNGEGL